MNKLYLKISFVFFITALFLVGGFFVAGRVYAKGSDNNFAVLANQAVTVTNGNVTGSIGTFQAPPAGSVTLTNSPVSGTVHVGDAAAVSAFNAFVARYNSLAPLLGTCDTAHTLTGTLDGLHLTSGVYCVDAVAKAGTLTLTGGGSWTFLVNGALTGTNFSVVMANGGNPCNVTWWVKDATTLTDSNFIGTILAGAAITSTRGTLHGNAYSQADVTITGTAVTGCADNNNNVEKVNKEEDRDNDNNKHEDKDNNDNEHGKLTCFDGHSDGTIFGGTCTLTGKGDNVLATLNNNDGNPNGDYSGVYFPKDKLGGKLLSNLKHLSFTFTGTPTAGSPRISLPVDTNGDGTTDFYAFIGSFYCNNGAGLLDAVNDPTCQIFAGAENFPNWAALLAAHPTWTVSADPMFVIADDAGFWTVKNVQLGK